MDKINPLPAPTKRAFVKTYGCQMNVYDSTRMTDILADEGYGVASTPDDADLVVFNTCHIREKAAEKTYSELGKLRKLKAARVAAGGEMIIAVAGCVAQAEGAEITRREKNVDLVFGPQTFHRLPQYLAKHKATGKPVVETEFPAHEKFAELAKRKPTGQSVSAYLTVQEGCDKFCTFCVVPYTRGAEVSRSPSEIETEARALVERGVKELTLLGQNVNAYHGDKTDLAALVKRLSSIDGLVRIRYTTSHPKDMTDSLIEAHATNSKLMPFLHLPVQSGSDRILKAMNRGHTAAHYFNLVERVRRATPGIAISGDFIVGFPGETDEDFEETLSLARQVGYASAYSFKYSPRPGTPAATKAEQVPDTVATERLYRLQAVVQEQQRNFNQTCVGRVLSILLEKPGRQEGQMIGRSPYLQSVHMEHPRGKAGDMVNAKILAVGTNSLAAQFEVTVA